MSVAEAHEVGEQETGHDFGWSFEPWAVLPMLLVAWLYWNGSRHIGGTADRRAQHLLFWTGLVSIALALMSPLHELGEHLFSAHMVEHEILMVVGVPVMVTARPAAILVAGMPTWARALTIAAIRHGTLKKLWSGGTELFSATVLHAGVLWLWHVPVLFQAANENEGVHVIQHLSFIVSALLFWTAILDRDRKRHDQGLAALALFFTSLQASLLGALITFSSRLWYPAGPDPEAIAGLSRFEDQQLSGLIMWVPACTLYVVAAILILARWLSRLEVRHG